jgi:hypothetical protein
MSTLLVADTDPLAPATGRRSWSTPRWLAVLGIVIVVLAAGLGVFIATTAGSVSSGVNVIGGQTAPQVRVTTDLYFVLSDLDAQAANALLVGTGPAMAAQRTAALNLYDQRRQQADSDLQQASADGGTDALAQQVVRNTLNQLGQYESLVAQAILVNQQGADPAGRPSSATLALYRQATDTMRGALTNVQTLTNHNHGILDSTYAADHGNALNLRIWIAVLGGLLVVALIGLQVQLRMRQRRRLNPALLLATVVGLVVTILGVGLLSTEANDLKVAKQDAFDSIVALSQSRAVSYDANADESRYLVDPQRAAQYQQAFLTKSQSLATLPGAGIFQYDAALAAALNNYRKDNANVGFGGFFGTELNNITFPGERTAAEGTLAAYQVYQLDDRHLRSLATEGNLSAAIAFDIGTTPGNSDYAFTQYDAALVAVIQINQNAFDAAVHDAQTQLTGWTTIIPGLASLLIVGLTALGLWRRVSEYR